MTGGDATKRMVRSAGPGRFGKLSLWLALGAAVLTAIGLAILANTPRHAEALRWEMANLFALTSLFVLAPLVHVFGAGFGIAALFRRNDRWGLGVTGVLLNGLALALAAGMLNLAMNAVLHIR